MFGPIQPYSKRFFAPIRHHWWNINPPLHTRIEQQAKQWVGPGGTAPKRAKTQQSARKVTAAIFWDFSGALFIDYLEKGKALKGVDLCDIFKISIFFTYYLIKKENYIVEKLFCVSNVWSRFPQKNVSSICRLDCA